MASDAGEYGPPDRVLYVVSQRPDPGYEASFDEWYDHEHLPELLACPGFDTATRYERIRGRDGSPQHLALYDVISMAAFDTDAYRRQASRGPAELSALAREVLSHRTVDIQAMYRLRIRATKADFDGTR